MESIIDPVRKSQCLLKKRTLLRLGRTYQDEKTPSRIRKGAPWPGKACMHGGSDFSAGTAIAR